MPAGCSPVISILRNLEVLSGQTVIAAGIPMDQTTCKRAFADSFHDEPAGKIMAVSDGSRDYCMPTPGENMESSICSLIEWTLKACGYLKEDGKFLVMKGVCSVQGREGSEKSHMFFP